MEMGAVPLSSFNDSVPPTIIFCKYLFAAAAGCRDEKDGAKEGGLKPPFPTLLTLPFSVWNAL